MADRLFGTDGVRGVANGELTAELALGIASSAVRVLSSQAGGVSSAGTDRPVVVVGRDTRPPGGFLEAAGVAGLASEGADGLRLGGVPTPAGAHARAGNRAAARGQVSARHKPRPGNSIQPV